MLRQKLTLLTLASLMLSTSVLANTSLVTTTGGKTESIVVTAPGVQAGSGTIESREETPLDSFDFLEADSVGDFPTETLYPYLQLRLTRTERMMVLPDGRIKFGIRRGTLQDNILDLISLTQAGEVYFPDKFPESLRMYNDFDLYGKDILDVLDQLIAPFFYSDNVSASYHPNNIVRMHISQGGF